MLPTYTLSLSSRFRVSVFGKPFGPFAIDLHLSSPSISTLLPFMPICLDVCRLGQVRFAWPRQSRGEWIRRHGQEETASIRQYGGDAGVLDEATVPSERRSTRDCKEGAERCLFRVAGGKASWGRRAIVQVESTRARIPWNMRVEYATRDY